MRIPVRVLIIAILCINVNGQEPGPADESVTNDEDEVQNAKTNDTSSESAASPSSSTTGSKVECDIRTAHHSDSEDHEEPTLSSSSSSSSGISSVRVVNSSEMLEFLDAVPTNSTRSRCAVVLFFYPSCVFSCKAAPHFNALGRLFPQIHVLALDAYSHNGINMRFGLVGVPTILFFHNSKIVAKFNDSDPVIENLVSFVNRVSGLSPAAPGTLEITDEDRAGPVPSVVEHRADYVLILSWIFVSMCACHFVIKSAFFKRFADYVRNNWREAEAQHEHQE